MATWLGHGIAGAAAAKALGTGRRGLVVAFALANAPDLDIPLGLALEGDGDAFHRAWWSHSPIVALYGAAGALAFYALLQAVRRRPLLDREARHWVLWAALVLLTHTVTDFVLINPTILVPHPDGEGFRGLLEAGGRELLALLTDLVFYGVLALAFYRLYLRRRERNRRRVA